MNPAMPPYGAPPMGGGMGGPPMGGPGFGGYPGNPAFPGGAAPMGNPGFGGAPPNPNYMMGGQNPNMYNNSGVPPNYGNAGFGMPPRGKVLDGHYLHFRFRLFNTIFFPFDRMVNLYISDLRRNTNYSEESN